MGQGEKARIENKFLLLSGGWKINELLVYCENSQVEWRVEGRRQTDAPDGVATYKWPLFHPEVMRHVRHSMLRPWNVDEWVRVVFEDVLEKDEESEKESEIEELVERYRRLTRQKRKPK